ncbi:MAG TPA: helix-turn-helix transcriptional regulator [Chloroflexia bacterium]|nr:helix-turn-helix transcriptional regulator [Chloroflexia bacterium]
MARYKPEDSQERQEAKKAVAAYLQEYLRQAEKTVSWLAEAAGLSRANLSRIVNGRILPDASTCQAIAQATGQGEEPLLRLAGYLSPGPGQSQEAEPSLADPELALYFSQINRMSSDKISFFKSFLKEEIGRVSAGELPGERPSFARPLESNTTAGNTPEADRQEWEGE